jgi:hypothetical protein
MIKKIFLLFLFTSVLFNCKKEIQDADKIVQKSIEVSGGDIISSSNIAFDFRDRHYRAFRDKGKYVLERHFIDKTNQYFDTITQITDAINNKGFQRFVNTFPVAVIDSMAAKYSASVNSVHYFSVLPYGLKDKAVKRTYLGEIKIKDKDYHKIKVTFNQEGGGKDFEDVFIYWMNIETLKVDYLAYSSLESNNIMALRFREAYNERYIEGVRFVDYNNYKPKNSKVALENLELLYENNDLELLSKIELENIAVSKNTNQ